MQRIHLGLKFRDGVLNGEVGGRNLLAVYLKLGHAEIVVIRRRCVAGWFESGDNPKWAGENGAVCACFCELGCGNRELDAEGGASASGLVHRDSSTVTRNNSAYDGKAQARTASLTVA